MALEKFCCCCKLSNGVVIIGALGIIVNIIFFTLSVSTNIFFEEFRHNEDLVLRLGESDITYKYRPTPLLWIGVVYTMVDLILSILLIAGAVKHSHFLMLPWIVVHGIAAIPIALASAVLLIVALPIYGPVYICWCVCSAYQKVQEVPYDKFDPLSLADNLPRR